MRLTSGFCAVLFLLLSCIDVQKPLLRDAQPYSYNFPGKSKMTLYATALAVLKAIGYTIDYAERYNWKIRTDEQPLPLGDQDCECATDAGIVYHNTNNTMTSVVLSLTIFDERMIIRADVTRKFITPEQGYGNRFYCVSKGTIENDLFRKIDSAVRVGF